MAEIKNFLMGVLVFGAIISGLVFTFTDWYSTMSPSTTVDTTFLGLQNSTQYIENWANDTTVSLKTSPLNNVPLVGPGFLLIQSIYNIIILILDLPAKVIGPIITAVAQALLLPPWFVAFAFAAIVVIIIIAVINAAKGKEL